MYPENSIALTQTLTDNPEFKRELILATVRQMVSETPADDYHMSRVGADIAENLIPRMEQKLEYEARQVAEEKITESLIAEERRKNDARDRLIEQRKAEPEPTAEELFGTEEHPK